MRTRLPLFPVALALILAGCKTAPPPETAEPPRNSLARAIEFSEEIKGSKRLAIPKESHLTDLDYKSRLTIDPQKQALDSLSASRGSTLSPLDKEDEVRLQQLSTLLAAASRYVNEARRINDEVRQARARNNLSAEQVAAIRSKIEAQGKLGKAVVDQIIELADAKAKARLGANATQDQIDNEVGRLTKPLIVDAEGKEVALNVEAYAKFLTEEMQFGISLATNDVARIERNGTTRLRIRAWVISRGKEPLGAHVENYDDIQDPMPPKDARVSFRMNDEERERVDRGYRVAEDAARLIRDLKSNESSLRQGLSGLLQTTRDDLKRLKNDLPKLDPTGSPLVVPALAALLTNAVTIVSNSPAVDDATKKDLSLLLGELESIFTLRSNIMTIVRLADQPSSADLVRTLSSVSDSVNGVVLAIAGLPGTIQTNLNRLKLLEQALGKVQGVDAAIIASLAQLLPETAKKGQELIALFTASYPNLAAELADIITRAPTVTLAAEINDANIDPRVRALSLDQIVPASVNLDNLPADRGDKLRVKSELLIPSGDQEQIVESDRTFSIDRFGWTSRFAAHLAFVDRQGSSESFVPAPSVSWTIHYRLRERERTGWVRKTWSFLDPGVGVNVAALNFDNNFEVGVGPHLTLFNDLLQCGYGYNLNVETDHGYLFLGIGILEALEGVGSLFHRAQSDSTP